MNDQIAKGQRILLLVGRGLLGLYFIIPGITKVTGFAATRDYMAAHGVPLIPVLSRMESAGIGVDVSLLRAYAEELKERIAAAEQACYDLAGKTFKINSPKQLRVILFEELGLNKREAKEIVEMFFDEVRESLENNQQVKLSGFGNFDLREKGERPGRNPKTGEEIPITARRVVTFRPGQKLKARVEAYAGTGE